jgi:hypothetical protein
VDGGGDVGGGVINRRRGVVGENRRPAWRRGSEDQERHEGGIRVGNETDTALQQDPRSRRTARWARRRPTSRSCRSERASDVLEPSEGPGAAPREGRPHQEREPRERTVAESRSSPPGGRAGSTG